MKTPKREYKNPADKFPGDIEPDSWEADFQAQESRWKRKNRVAQLKRTIARLMRKNDEACSILRTVQKIIEVALAKDTTDIEISFKWENSHGRKESTRKARLLRRAHRRACRAINAENGQQPARKGEE